MKARVKATGDIVEVEPTFVDGNKIYSWVTDNGYFYSNGSLDFESLTEGLTDVKEKSFPKDEPDYRERLKHQYAGMAMQGILSNCGDIYQIKESMVAFLSITFANELINQLKKEYNEMGTNTEK